MEQDLHNNDTNRGLFRGRYKIGEALRRTSGYAEASRTNQLLGSSIRWEAGVAVCKQGSFNGRNSIKIERQACRMAFINSALDNDRDWSWVKSMAQMLWEAPILDYVLIIDTSSQSSFPSPVEDPFVLIKLVQGKPLSIVDLRMEDDLPDLQTEMTGLATEKMPKSETLNEEPTNARGKDLLHVSMCIGSCLFSADLEETLKKSKKDSKKLSKMDGKVLCFNKEDGNGVRSGESVSDSQFLNKNHVICVGNEQSDESGPNLQPE
ncbi:hypothetical protein Ancab_033619 [Ancistrocladus abbreviatus]